MSRTKKIAILAIIAMVLTMLPVSLFAAADSDRLAGADRIGTAIAIADAGWASAGTVILAPADQANLVDALAAAPLAGQENAPILLTFKNALNADVKAKIAALGASKVYVVGAISDAVVAEVNAMTGVTAEKLAGADRLGTADAINAKLVNPAGSFVVGYNALADALSVASYAAAKNFAIVLTKPDGTVDASKLVGSTTYLVGGTAVVKDYEGATRLAGADRYATNAAVAGALAYNYGKVYVANGLTLVDALAVAPLAAKTGAFVILADANNVPSIAGVTGATDIIAVGGVNAVSEAVLGKVYTSPASFQVESAKVLNLKQVEIKFTRALDKTSAEDIANYVLRDNAGNDILAAGGGLAGVAKLQSDGRTVILTAGGAGQLTNLKDNRLEVLSAIKDANKEALGTTYVNSSLNAVDITAPTAVSVSMEGPKTIKVVFSEPIDAAIGGANNVTSSDFRIDNGSIGISSAITASDSARSITLTAGANLSVGSHTLDINVNNNSNFKDYAGVALVKQTLSFNVVAVTDAPTVAIDSAKPSEIVLKFNRPVKNVNLAEIYHGYSSNTGNAAVKVGGSGDYSDTWKVEFPAGKYVPNGTSTLYIKNATASSSKIEDRWENKMPDTSLTVTVTADNTPPTVVSVTVENRKEIKVKFSEDVNATDAVDFNLYVFKKSDGTIMKNSDFSNLNNYGNPVAPAVLSYNASKYTTTITFNADFPLGDYKLTMKDIKDVAAYTSNKLVEVTKDFTVTNTNAAKLQSAILKGSKIYLTFDKDMATSGIGSVLDISNYQIDKPGTGTASAMPSGSTVALGDNAKQVVITLGSTTGIAAGQSKVAAYVYDNTGKAISAFNNNLTLVTPASTAIDADDIRKFKLIDKKTLTFEVIQPLKGVDPTKIKIAATDLGTNGIDVDSASYVNQNLSDGTYGAVVTLKVAGTNTANTLATAPTGAGKINNVVGTADGTNDIWVDIGGLKNQYDETNPAAIKKANAANTVKDLAAPYILSVTTADNDGNGYLDEITVVFSENVYAPSINETDFSVDKYSVKAVTSVINDRVVLALHEKATPDTGVKPDVKIVGDIQDASADRNVVSSSDVVVPADGAGPAVVGLNYNLATAGVYANGDTITITFSESINAAAIAITDISASAGADLTDATLTPAAGNVSQLVITLGAGTVLASGDTLTIDKTKVVDSVPNAMANDYVITLP